MRASKIIDGPAVAIIDGMGGCRAVQVPVASSLFGRSAIQWPTLACEPFRSLSSLYAERERPSAIGSVASELMRQAGAGLAGC